MLTYILTATPILAIALLMASGRASSIGAGLIGASLATIIAMTAAPTVLTPGMALAAAAKGLWLSWLVGLVILSGLFFREIVSEDDAATGETNRRRRVFAACFLIGPFTEAATGFGVGQVATVALLRGLAIPPLHMALLALFSQILVPWGAMANGTLVGAHFAGVTSRDLGLYSALLTVPLLLAWLLVFWRFCAAAGVDAKATELASELAWVVFIAALLIAANMLFGPEVAAMAALGPLILFRFWLDEQPNIERWRSAAYVGLPYAALVAGLALSRSFATLTEWLGQVASVQPFTGEPVWHPLLHPGSWLLAVGCMTALVSGRAKAVGPAMERAWLQGRKALLAIAIYLVIAGVMADSGMANDLASGSKQLFGQYAVIATPLLAGAFGFLTGSGAAANGLLMASQANVADSHIGLLWIAALQNTAAAALTMLSPLRVAIGCALVGRMELERAVYAGAWPLGAAAFGILLAAAALLLVNWC